MTKVNSSRDKSLWTIGGGQWTEHRRGGYGYVPFHTTPAGSPAAGWPESFDKRERYQDTGIWFGIGIGIGGGINGKTFSGILDSSDFTLTNSGERAIVLDPETVYIAGISNEIPQMGEEFHADLTLFGLDEVLHVPVITGMANLISPFHYTQRYDILLARDGARFLPKSGTKASIPFVWHQVWDMGMGMDTTLSLPLLEFAIDNKPFLGILDTASKLDTICIHDAKAINLSQYPLTGDQAYDSRTGYQTGYFVPLTLVGLGTFCGKVYNAKIDLSVISAWAFLSQGFRFILTDDGISFAATCLGA